MGAKKNNDSSRYRPHANPQLARDMAELRRSNAAGTHADKRTRRRRTRGADKSAAIRENTEQ